MQNQARLDAAVTAGRRCGSCDACSLFAAYVRHHACPCATCNVGITADELACTIVLARHRENNNAILQQLVDARARCGECAGCQSFLDDPRRNCRSCQPCIARGHTRTRKSGDECVNNTCSAPPSRTWADCNHDYDGMAFLQQRNPLKLRAIATENMTESYRLCSSVACTTCGAPKFHEELGASNCCQQGNQAPHHRLPPYEWPASRLLRRSRKCSMYYLLLVRSLRVFLFSQGSSQIVRIANS